MRINPLSSLKYCFRNISKLAPLVGVISLSILGATITSAIADSASTDFRRNLNFYKSYYVVQIRRSENTDAAVNQIKSQLENSGNVDYFLQGDFSYILTKAIVATMRRPILFLKDTDYSRFLSETNLETTDGKLPDKNSNQLALTQRSAKNKNLSLEDSFGNKVNAKEVWLIGEYKLSGLLDFKDKADSDKSFQVGLGNYDSVEGGNVSFFIHPKNDKRASLDSELQEIKNRYPNIYTETEFSYKEFLDSELESIGFLLSVITTSVTIIVTLSVGLLSIIFLNQRSEEIGLLLAIGYNKLFIIKKIFTEMFIQIIIGWIIGLVFTTVVYTYLNQTVFEPKAIVGLTIWQPQTFTSSVSIPVSVILFSLGFIIYKLNRFDPIFIIEKK